MHICFLTNEFPKPGIAHGGVGTFIRNLSLELVKFDIKVSIVGTNYINVEEYENFQGINIYRTKKHNLKGLIWYNRAKSINQKIAEIHQKDPISIVEGTELALAFINKIPEVKYLIRMNGGHHFFSNAENKKTNPWKSIQEKLSFKKADHVISVSKYTAESTRDLLKLGDISIHIIPNPIDVDLFKPADPKAVVKNKLLFVGTICEKKGVRQLAMAMPKILQAFPDAQLEIVGRDWIDPNSDISFTEYLKTFITPESKDHITITGPVDLVKIPEKIASSEICVYPSHMEALPLAWLEVLASAKAFVGSISGPGPEVVKHGETGLLADCYDPDDIANHVIDLLGNKEKALELGRNARKDVLERFDVKVLVKKNIDYYRSIAS
ncbi:MAG: glycosyltransferase family 4 protein [Algoriphagus sp.]|uniref:glycosyltransferase family 4 protein n=1 Tax=Algoriphagus sp. TaxID=1872435 RepID=UPI0026019B7F|nr:glycosyltransferase family 4 protein [Algoriphagus sp.]MDG1275694.1 glycosyltransferase family 4 protein [Algoriphagus sp.]